ncbi:hypothetical protein T4A_10175 [Trichinella pseudospiralis]|uniref:Uncharacterized protein n=1 Tax=Trichinella pseudospiralis TaxID=6337 RepID=A0A0V1EQZ7_TRIPS|nr:hypothetical protein T4A_10175 [Trichinella pseudospiralis]
MCRGHKMSSCEDTIAQLPCATAKERTFSRESTMFTLTGICENLLCISKVKNTAGLLTLLKILSGGGHGGRPFVVYTSVAMQGLLLGLIMSCLSISCSAIFSDNIFNKKASGAVWRLLKRVLAEP